MPIKTTKGNIGAHKRGILMSNLPKTFRDAVTICRKLRIDYLWIDSLCIIQDSQEDWEQEAAQMARIYGAADFTIAAHSANDSTGGCFVARADTGGEPFSAIKYVGPRGEKGSLFVRPVPPGSPHGDHLMEDLPRLRESGLSKLSTRGWVFQERLLSRRTLHYTPYELVFECDAGFRCECSLTYSGLPRGIERYKQKYIKCRLVHFNLNRLTTADYLDSDAYLAHSLQKIMDIKERNPRIDFDWPNVVEEFTQLELTFASDRLPALYGLAAAKQRVTTTPSNSDQYLFGLWKHDIIPGLLWQVGRADRLLADDCESKRQPNSYAPSWSWASVTGPVHYERDLRSMDSSDPMKLQPYYQRFEILEVKVTPSTTNPFGPGKGTITVMCRLVPLRIFHVKPRDVRICPFPSLMRATKRVKRFHFSEIIGRLPCMRATVTRDEFTPQSFIAVSRKAIPGKNECPFGYFNPDVRDNGFEFGQGDEGDENEYSFMIIGHVREMPIGLVLKKCGADLFMRVGFMRDCKYSLKHWEAVAEMSIATLQ